MPKPDFCQEWLSIIECLIRLIVMLWKTKAFMYSMQLRDIEKGKMHCAKGYLKAISSDNAVYDVLESYSVRVKYSASFLPLSNDV